MDVSGSGDFRLCESRGVQQEEEHDSALLFIGQLHLKCKQMAVFSETSLEKTSTWKRGIMGWGKRNDRCIQISEGMLQEKKKKCFYNLVLSSYTVLTIGKTDFLH